MKAQCVVVSDSSSARVIASYGGNKFLWEWQDGLVCPGSAEPLSIDPLAAEALIVEEFLQFLKDIDKNAPKNLDLHLVMDNYASHKHPRVRTWLARRPRYHVHFTPTYSSWLNQVERWFAIITQKAIRRGSFRSTKELTQRIDNFVQTYNRKASPFRWVATADSILEKLERLCMTISGTAH